MHYLIFDGKNSRDFMVIISGEDTWKKPSPILERITVPGRNGEIIAFNGAYENVEVTYHCGLPRDFDRTYTEFVNYLLARPGYQKLEDSYHPGYYRMASIQSIGNPSVSKLNRSASFDITFTCKPQTFLKHGEKKQIFTRSSEIYNPTLYPAKPLIRVYGTGELVVAEDTVTITAADGYTDLDCDLEDAYKDDSSHNCNGNILLSGDHFPVIPGGRHGIIMRSGISRVEIVPRWWQL